MPLYIVIQAQANDNHPGVYKYKYDNSFVQTLRNAMRFWYIHWKSALTSSTTLANIDVTAPVKHDLHIAIATPGAACKWAQGKTRCYVCLEKSHKRREAHTHPPGRSHGSLLEMVVWWVWRTVAEFGHWSRSGQVSWSVNLVGKVVWPPK